MPALAQALIPHSGLLMPTSCNKECVSQGHYLYFLTSNSRWNTYDGLHLGYTTKNGLFLAAVEKSSYYVPPLPVSKDPCTSLQCADDGGRQAVCLPLSTSELPILSASLNSSCSQVLYLLGARPFSDKG